MSESEERQIARPACDQLDLRPVGGGDSGPDRYGLASQSTACLPPDVLELFAQPEEESPCNKAYQDVENKLRLKDNLGISACEVERQTAQAQGATGWAYLGRAVWRSGLKAITGAGRKPKLEVIQGGKGQASWVYNEEAALRRLERSRGPEGVAMSYPQLWVRPKRCTAAL